MCHRYDPKKQRPNIYHAYTVAEISTEIIFESKDMLLIKKRKKKKGSQKICFNAESSMCKKNALNLQCNLIFKISSQIDTIS